MKRETIYQRLRDIGCTVDTSDAIAEVLEHEPDNKVNALIDWAMATPEINIYREYDITVKDMKKLIKKIKKKIFLVQNGEKVSNMSRRMYNH